MRWIKKTLLIVEDEADLREVVQYFVKDHFNVIEAANGVEALEKLKTAKPDLILSDFNMPQLDGLEFLKILFERNIRIPVIWITGRGGPELYRSAWSLGVYDYIEKPFSPDQLLSCLQGALSTHGHEDVDPLSAFSERAVAQKTHFNLQLPLEKSLYDALSRHGLKTGFSVTSLINDIVREYVEAGRTSEL